MSIKLLNYILRQKGINPPPVWTISRILKRHNLIKNKCSTPYISERKAYTYKYINSQKMDIVSSHYLASKARYYLNSIILLLYLLFTYISVKKSKLR